MYFPFRSSAHSEVVFALGIRCFNRNRIKIKRQFEWKTNKKILFGRKNASPMDWPHRGDLEIFIQNVEVISVWVSRVKGKNFLLRKSEQEELLRCLFIIRKSFLYSKSIAWHFRSTHCDIVLTDKSLSASCVSLFVFCCTCFSAKDSVATIASLCIAQLSILMLCIAVVPCIIDEAGSVAR